MTPLTSTALRTKFLEWVQPRGDDRYALYRRLLSAQDEAFWVRLSTQTTTLDDGRQELVHYLFMGAVQYLVLTHPDEQLAALFPASPAFRDEISDNNDALFADFVTRRFEEIWNLVRTREVQINKLGRLALFAPFFIDITKRTSAPLAFVDVGSSIGLGLLWPQFNYVYPGYGRIQGSGNASELVCEIKGTEALLAFTGHLPEPSFLCGIDIEPLSATSEDDTRWLLALTAPHDEKGRTMLRIGLSVAEITTPRIERGCVVDVLPWLETEWTDRHDLVFYHSMTMHHLRASKITALAAVLSDMAQRRRVFEISVEWSTEKSNGDGPRPVEVMLVEWTKNNQHVLFTAQTDPAADGSYLQFL
jgi:hypothetical protein